MKNKFILIFTGLCLLCPAVFAQTTSADTSKSFAIMQGTGVYEDGMMSLLQGLRQYVWSGWDMFIVDAQALAAIFMIIYFAIKSYEMMAGDKQLEIMPLLRPFGLVMVIIWWSPFVKVVEFPTEVMEQQAQVRWQSAQTDADNLRLTRANLMTQMADSLYSVQAQTQVAEKESDTWYGQAWDQVSSTVKQGISSVVAPLLELKQRLQISMQLLMTQLLELISIWILRVATYVIFFLQVIYSTILIILGPFAVAVSILPAFRDSFTTWVARYISVNLYATIAYIIMWLCAYVQQYAMQVEISRYTSLLQATANPANKMAMLGVFAANGLLSFGTVIVTFLMGAICMFTVPSISTWIVSTSGITSAASTFGRSAGTVLGTARKVTGTFL